MNSPQPEWTIEQKQQHYGQLWHRFDGGLPAGNPHWQDHIHAVVGVAQERTLPTEQCQQGKWVVSVLERLLKDSKTQAIEGDRYSVHQDRQNHSLSRAVSF